MTKKKPSPKPADTAQDEFPDSPNIEAPDAIPSKGGEQVDQVDNTALIDEAVSAGRPLIEQGKPKIEAAMVIYEKLEQLPQSSPPTAGQFHPTLSK